MEVPHSDLEAIWFVARSLLLVVGCYAAYRWWTYREPLPYVGKFKDMGHWVVSVMDHPPQFDRVLGPYPTWMDAVETCRQLNMQFADEDDYVDDDSDDEDEDEGYTPDDDDQIIRD